MKSRELAALAGVVARNVRRQIHRSANRQLTDEGGPTTWLQAGIPAHINLLHNLVRSASKPGDETPVNSKIGLPLEKITKKRKTRFLLVFKKTKYDPVTLRSLKRTILQFIDHEGIDLSYRTQEAENRFCDEFGIKLANYLNARGYRKIIDNHGQPGTERWKENVGQGIRVINSLNSDLIEHQRMEKWGINPRTFADPTEALDFQLEYIIGQARNALRFHIGNCEEVASTAFVTFILGKRAEDDQIDPGEDPIPVELAYIKTRDGSAHFFVVMNRGNIDTAFIDEGKAEWLADKDTIICDPWIDDIGLGGRVTSDADSMQELRDWIEDARVCVRATGHLAQGSPKIKPQDEPRFYI